VVADLIRACGDELVGYADADGDKVGREVAPGGGSVVIGEPELLGYLERGRFPDGVDAAALGVGDNRARQLALARCAELCVPSLVHPSAVVSPSATLGRGSVVFPAAVVNAGARIGVAVIVNSAAVVEHDCVLADAVHVSPHATLAGGVVVGERSWIGAGATVIQGVRVGADVTVGAGAVVLRDVSAGSTVVGVPAELIHRRKRPR
jgi:sugar O-acyltransferase (sialic acid O-acetyltransferase NeuD family)